MQYQIGDFARMAQISPKQLKYYEQCGLIAPARIDAVSGYRYYEAEQLRAVAHVRAFMSMGFATAEIKALLLEADYDAAFERKRWELEEAAEECRRRLALLSFYRDAIQSHDFNQPYRATVKTTPKGEFAMLRGRFADPDAFADEGPVLLEAVQSSGGVVSSPLMVLARFWDSDFEIENFDAELLLKVARRGGESERFEYTVLTSMPAVSVVHRGGYDFLNEAYAFAYMWIDRNGCKAAGLPVESYLCGPTTGMPVEDYITELYIPIEQR